MRNKSVSANTGSGLHRLLCLVALLVLWHCCRARVYDGTEKLYFNMKAVSWWIAGNNGDGNFAYFFNSSTNKWSAHSIQQSGNDYYVVVPAGTWTHVILTRNNTSTSPSWSNRWNQTGDIPIHDKYNYISSFSENSTSATWTNKYPSCIELSVEPASVNTTPYANTALTAVSTGTVTWSTTTGYLLDDDNIYHHHGMTGGNVTLKAGNLTGTVTVTAVGDGCSTVVTIPVTVVPDSEDCD